MVIADMVHWLVVAAYIGGPMSQATWLGPKDWRPLGAVLYSSRKLSELLQWLCHDDIIIIVIITIIITKAIYKFHFVMISKTR